MGLIGKYIGIDRGQPSDWNAEKSRRDSDLDGVLGQLHDQVVTWDRINYRSFAFQGSTFIYSNPYVEFKGAYTLTNVHSNVLRDLM